MKKYSVARAISGILVAAGLVLMLSGEKTEAWSRIRKIKMDDGFVYKKIDAPKTLLGMKSVYEGIEDGTGEVITKYEGAGNSATLTAYGAGPASTVYDVPINRWAVAVQKYRYSADITEDMCTHVAEETSYDNILPLLQNIPNGELVYENVLAHRSGPDEEGYRMVSWKVCDFTARVAGDLEDAEYVYEKGYTGQDPYMSSGGTNFYAAYYSLQFDNPITESDFEDIYNFVKEVSVSYTQ